MRIDLGLAVAVFIALAGMSMMSGPEPDPCETYHEMRVIYEQSNGEFGWPEGAQGGCGDE